MTRAPLLATALLLAAGAARADVAVPGYRTATAHVRLANAGDYPGLSFHLVYQPMPGDPRTEPLRTVDLTGGGAPLLGAAASATPPSWPSRRAWLCRRWGA